MTVKLKGAALSSPASLLDVELQHGKPLRAEATGDAPGWAAEHRDALRAVVTEQARFWSVALGCVTPPGQPQSSGGCPPG
jgi:hypothetical protein